MNPISKTRQVVADTNPKVAAATVAAAAVTLLAWGLGEFTTVAISVEAQGAATTLAVALAGWFKTS